MHVQHAHRHPNRRCDQAHREEQILPEERDGQRRRRDDFGQQKEEDGQRKKNRHAQAHLFPRVRGQVENQDREESYAHARDD